MAASRTTRGNVPRWPRIASSSAWVSRDASLSEKPGTSSLQWLEFVGDNQLLTTKTLKQDLVFQLWDIKAENKTLPGVLM